MMQKNRSYQYFQFLSRTNIKKMIRKYPRTDKKHKKEAPFPAASFLDKPQTYEKKCIPSIPRYPGYRVEGGLGLPLTIEKQRIICTPPDRKIILPGITVGDTPE
jgi:hypothetical protein